MKKEIVSREAPAAIGPFSQGVIYDKLVFVSGQLPVEPTTGEIPEGIEKQTRVALNNVKAVLEAAGSSLDNVLKATVFLANWDDFGAMNDVYAEFFCNGIKPARAAFQAVKLAKDALVEIEAIAFKD